MKTKKNNVNTNKTIKKFRFFNFSNKSHLKLIENSIESHNVSSTIETILKSFGKNIVQKIKNKSKYLLEFESKVLKHLKLESKSEKKFKKNSKASSFVTFRINNNKLTFLIDSYQSPEYKNYYLSLHKFNDIQTFDDNTYNLIIEISSSNPEEIYISQINKTKYMSGSKAVEIGLEFSKLLHPKLITIIDAAYVPKKNSYNNNNNTNISYFTKRTLPLSILRLLSKDTYDLSWYNSFGFQLIKSKANNSFFDYEQIKFDLDKLRKTPIENVLKYFELLFEKKDVIFVKVHSSSSFRYNRVIFDKNDKILYSLFEKMKTHKILTLKDFINKLNNEEKTYFINLFFDKHSLFVGILENKKFYKSPFYNYLYILKYVGGTREIKFD
jgi:hypothetical protein